MPYITCWCRGEILSIEKPDTLAKENCNKCKIVMFLAFKVVSFSTMRYKYLEKALATLLALA